MPSFDEYMGRYDHEHHHPANKAMHAIGIPMIFAGVILLILTLWKWGLAFFLLGWVLLLLGHRIEGNKPAFFQGPVYFLVGPLWVLKEVKDALFGRTRREAAPHS